jgi:hypothetical protein
MASRPGSIFRSYISKGFETILWEHLTEEFGIQALQQCYYIFWTYKQRPCQYEG